VFQKIPSKQHLYQGYRIYSNSSTNKSCTITYSGYLVSSLRSIKFFSIGSLCLTYLISPVILFAETNIDLSARIIMVVIALSTTSFSTALIHFVLSPYVTRMQYSNDKFQIETLNLLGKKIIWIGNSKKLKENRNGRLFANIESIEDKKRWFYIHNDQQGSKVFQIINSTK
ncbi:unnamed protein product, partial [Pneumocystis jirovecii]